MKKVFAALCLLACCSSIPGQQKPNDKSKTAETAASLEESFNGSVGKLPVRRVVLYKNGVGYFEHLGRVRGSQEVHVDFTSAQLNPSTGVRITEKDLQVEVGRYLGLIASSRDQDVRRMIISTTGSGERNLYVSYISEVPIWKTTYRIVLPSKPDKKPLLQGWAIVDNTVGEDWDGVELSLVAGAPHSFIQQLSEPFYGRRPVVPLPESVQLSPQTHAATLLRGNGRLSGVVTDPQGAVIAGAMVRLLDENNNVIAETSTESNGQYSLSGVSTGNYRVVNRARGLQKGRSRRVERVTRRESA